MKRSTKSINSENNFSLIKTISADHNWQLKEKKKTIWILAVLGIIIFILSLIYQNIIYALVRALIISIACLILYFKSDSILVHQIQIYNDGTVTIRKGLRKIVIFHSDFENIFISQNNRYWVIGDKKIKLEVAAFPNITKLIKDSITK